MSGLSTDGSKNDERRGQAPELESAGQLIIECGFRGEPSPFWDQPTWTEHNATDLLRRTFDNYDNGKGNFLTKLRDQLADAETGVIVLAAELIALTQLPLVNVRSATKRDHIELILSWANAETRTPEQVLRGMESRGVFNGGQGYNNQKWHHFVWLARFVQQVRSEPSGVLDDALAGPEAFGTITDAVDDQIRGVRFAIEYMMWPNYFEPVISQNHRKLLLDAYAWEIGGPSGSDQRSIAKDLAAIHRIHDVKAGHRVDWYEEPFINDWLRKASTKAGQRAWLVRQQQGSEQLLEGWLVEGEVSLQATHLGQIEAGSTLPQIQGAVESGYDHVDYAERKQSAHAFHRFLTLMGTGDMVFTRRGDELYVGVVESGARYVSDEPAHLVCSVDWQLLELPVEDVDAMVLSTFDERGTIVDATAALAALTTLLSKTATEDVPVKGNDPLEQDRRAHVELLPDVVEEFAGSVHIERDQLQEVVEMLRTRRQVVFYGPPGTGKTYLAGKLARYLATAEHADHVQIVQFHPSYAYEDFFEGYRPAAAENGQLGFSLEPGPLRRIAAEASAEGNRDKPFLLIIDEMNRGNLAKIFGELYFLLEYRDQSINLQYSPGSTFKLPPNLFIIGTMNTADRSIAMIDAAIRRRFAFIELHPQEGMIEGLLDRFLEATRQPSLRADLLRALNLELAGTDRDLMIGPSYFMGKHAESNVGLERIWRYELLPLLEEHYFGRYSRDEVRRRFGLSSIRSKAEALISRGRSENGVTGGEPGVVGEQNLP
ncbi:restriction endonuclease [Arthrobacter sp. 7749]|nr:restriction endonuclease [Arthrobacter sp. 7749]